jgi:hypothetical protein
MFIRHHVLLATVLLTLLALPTLARADDEPRAQDEPTTPFEPEPIAETPEGLDDEQETFAPVACPLADPSIGPGFQFYAGALWLRPSADNLGWAVLTTEENFNSPVPLASPYWNIENLEPGYEPGFELGLGYRFANPGTDFRVHWQHLRTDTSDSAAVTQSDGQWISPFSQTGPPTAGSFPEMYDNTGVNLLLSADANVKFSYDAVTFDLGQSIYVGPRLAVRLFAGLTYANLKEQLVSNFYGAPPDPDAMFPENVPLWISLDNTSTFSGVGPRLGFDTTLQTAYGFRFTSQLAGALLIGRTQPAQYLFAATSPELAAFDIPVNYEGIYSEAFTHVVYAATARLGIGYLRPLASGSLLTIDAGYQAALYINPFSGYETNDNVIAIQFGSLSTASMRHTLSNFSLDGFYLNAGLMW